MGFPVASPHLVVLAAAALLLGAGGAVAVLRRAAHARRPPAAAARRHPALARHLELLSEHAEDVVLMVDGDGRIVQANDRVREQYGWSPVDLAGHELRKLRAPGHQSFEAQLARLRELGRLRYETVHRRRDGSTFPVEVSARGFEVEGRWYFQAIVRDVTERKRVLAELSYQAEMLRNVHEAVIGLDAAHVIRSWNRAAERIYGIPAEDALGCTIGELMPSVYEGFASWREFTAAVDRVDHLEFAVRRRLRDGREVDVEGAAVVLRDDERRITGYATINRDVTARKRAEASLLQARKLEAVGLLASGVAHDFNNLLVSILSCSEFLLQSVAPADPRRADLEEIRHAGERAAHLVRQLLTFARKGASRPATLDLADVARGMEHLLRRAVGEQIELSFNLDPCLAHVDRGQLEQVLMNLALNARDAMPGGGRLLVETRAARLERLPLGTDGVPPGSYAVLSVADTGCGIAAGDLPRIFEPFFTTKGDGKGTGLGLSTAYGIVSEAGGRIAVDSTPGRGTRFTVYLPSRDGAVQAERPPPPAPVRAGGRAVLVVEDEPLVRRAARRALEASGYVVLEAGCADDALRELEGAEVDVVVSDVVMPGRSGVELASALSALRPGLPVVHMSGYSEWQRSTDRSPVFLAKPFTAEALVSRVEEGLSAAQGRAANPAGRRSGKTP